MKKKIGNEDDTIQARKQTKAQAGKEKKQSLQKTQVEMKRTIQQLRAHQTELKTRLEELEERLKQYSDLYAFAPVGYFTLNRNGIIRQTNLRGAQQLGVGDGKLVGKRFERFVSAGSRPAFSTFLKQIFESQKVDICELAISNKEGDTLWIRMRGKVAVNMRECLVVAMDITRRKQMEDALRESEAKFKSVYQSSPIGIELFDHDGVLIEINAACTEIFGLADGSAVKGFKLFEDPNLTKEQKKVLRRGGNIHYEIKFDFEKVKALNLYQTSRSDFIYLDLLVTPMISAESVVGYLVHVRDITDRRETEEALRTSQELLRKLFHFSPLPTVLIKLPERTVVDVSTAFEELFGYTHAEMIQKSVSDIALWANRSEHQRMLDEMKRNNRIRGFDFEFKSKSGRTGYGLLSAEVIEQPPDKYVLAKIVDVTERKWMEKMLTQTNERLSLAQRLAGAGIWDWDMVSGNLTWSSNLFDLFGLDSQNSQATFDTWRRIIHPDDAEIASHRIDEAIKNKTVLDSEYRIIHPDGTIHWIKALGDTLYLEGTPVRMAGVCFDISARRLAEERLRESEERFSAAFHASPAAQIISILESGLIIDANEAFGELMGYTHDELIGRTSQELDLWVNFKDRKKMVELLRQDEGIQNMELQLVNRYGKLHTVLVSVSVIVLRGEKRMVSTLLDITDRKQAEEKLQEANKNLEEQLGQIKILRDYLHEQATHDALTGLYNRRYFHETITREIARAKRDNYPISMMMIDIDYFKEINDTYGHEFGDKVLKTLGDLFRTNTREGDIACRYGGDEFIIVMPNAGMEDAERRAEIIRQKCNASPTQLGEMEFTPTLSIGVAAYPQHGKDGNEIVRAADGALYQSKQGGRNCVHVWQVGDLST